MGFAGRFYVASAQRCLHTAACEHRLSSENTGGIGQSPAQNRIQARHTKRESRYERLCKVALILSKFGKSEALSRISA
jgi:hypothetical protein